jgi:predicted nucleic acid-binding protein
VILYADTSALAKLFLIEESTARMRVAMDDANVTACAAIGYVEIRATFAAALRAGRLPVVGRDRLIAQLDRLWQEVSEIPLDRPLLRRAGDLAEQMRLRGYDAVHLAALHEAGSPTRVVFACWDNELRRAARELGYTLVPE